MGLTVAIDVVEARRDPVLDFKRGVEELRIDGCGLDGPIQQVEESWRGLKAPSEESVGEAAEKLVDILVCVAHRQERQLNLLFVCLFVFFTLI